MQGQVFKIHSDFYYVENNGKNFECKIRDVLKKQKEKILVGDFVEVQNGFIERILPRKNVIARPNVSNIDQVVIISAVKEPELNFKQLNRYICLAKYCNIPVKLCFNKNDLSADDNVIERVFEIYEPLGYDIIFTSALEKTGVEDFEELLKGKTTVFCGMSGVGKSSLINALNPLLDLRTKNVSEKTERGVHTTRHSEIFTIKDDIKIVDTPGFSNMKFDFLLPQEVGNLFEEISELKSGCKFSDCLHVNEVGCEVLANLDKINISRYESYLEFIEEAKVFREKVKFEGVKRETHSKEHQGKSTAKISARKREGSRRTLKQQLRDEIE